MSRILSPIEIICKRLGFKSVRELNEKYSLVSVSQQSLFIEKENRYGIAFKTVLKEIPSHKELRKLFLVYPHELGYGKTAKILVASKEPTVENNRLVEGYSTFELKVEISDLGEWKSKYLYVFNGILMVVDYSTSPPFSQAFDFKKLKVKQLGFCNFDKAFSKRRHISRSEYLRLKSEGKLHYCISRHGSVEITSIRRSQKFELQK